MSTSSYVGFFRNLLCCVKDLQLFSSLLSLPMASTPLSSLPPFSFLSASVFPPDLRAAFLKTTVLESFIFPLQVYAFYSLTVGGFNGLKGTLGKVRDEAKRRQEQGAVWRSATASTVTNSPPPPPSFLSPLIPAEHGQGLVRRAGEGQSSCFL